MINKILFLIRLSVAAEKNMEEHTPFIGNLCDINRPTALAGKFCSLHTDEYADAMEVIERSMDEAGAVHVMLEWLKVCNTKAMEVIERSMDEAGAVHVMLEWLKIRSHKANYITNLSIRKKGHNWELCRCSKSDVRVVKGT